MEGRGTYTPDCVLFSPFFLSLLVGLFLEQISILNLDVKVTVARGVPLSDPGSGALGHWEC